MIAIRQMLKDALYPVSPSITDTTRVENNQTLTDLLKIVYPTARMLSRLPDKEYINVGILADEQTLYWNASYLACIIANVTMVIIPPIESQAEMLHYMARANVNILFVNDDNPFDVDRFNKQYADPYRYYFGISLVYDVANQVALFARRRLTNLKLGLGDKGAKQLDYIPKDKFDALFKDSRIRAKLIMPSSGTVNTSIGLYYIPYKRLDLVIQGIGSFMSKHVKEQFEVYTRAPKWRFHLLTVLQPILAGIHVVSYPSIARGNSFDAMILDAPSAKEVIDNIYYSPYISRFARQHLPERILKYVGKIKLKRLIERIGKVIILNADIPGEYIRILTSAGINVVTTYGCVECSQLAAWHEHKANQPVKDPSQLSHILSTIIIEVGYLEGKKHSIITGKGIAKSLFNKKEERMTPHDIITHSPIKNVYVPSFATRSCDLVVDEMYGEYIPKRNLANFFRVMPYVREANIAKSSGDYICIVEIAKLFAARADMSMTELKYRLETIRKYVNSLLSQNSIHIERVVIHPNMIKSMSGEPRRWVHDPSIIEDDDLLNALTGNG